MKRVGSGKSFKRKRHNRHGFINFGGRHTGQKGLIEPSDIDAIRWISRRIEHFGECTTVTFDECYAPVGAVIRHGLRHNYLITEYAVPAKDYKAIALTPKAGVLLKGVPNEPS